MAMLLTETKMPDDLDFLLHDIDFGSSLGQTQIDTTDLPVFSYNA